MDLFPKVAKESRVKEVVLEEVVVPWGQSTFVNSVDNNKSDHLLDADDGGFAKGPWTEPRRSHTLHPQRSWVPLKYPDGIAI